MNVNHLEERIMTVNEENMRGQAGEKTADETREAQAASRRAEAETDTEPVQNPQEPAPAGSRRQRDRKRLYSSLLSCILWISVLDFLVKLLTGVVTTVMYMTGTPMSGLSVWSPVLTLWNVVIQSMTPLYIAFAALAADRLLRILDQNSQHTEKA